MSLMQADVEMKSHGNTVDARPDTAKHDIDGIVVLDGTISPHLQAPSRSSHVCKGKPYWMLLLLIILAGLIGVAFQLGLFDKESTGGAGTDGVEYDRKSYYGELQSQFLPRINSPQAQAIEWLAYHDVPLEGEERNRLWQRFALCALYFEQGGPLWSVRHEWIDGAGIHECDWVGVDCNPSMEVTGLRLASGDGISLTGARLTTELGLLSKLSYFDASNQRMQGEIPDEWKRLTNLLTLDLSNNKIRGTIPSFLGSFTSLRKLALGGNRLASAFPETLFGLTSLEHLELQNNLGIRGLINEILTSLPNLLYLNAGDREMRGYLPDQPISNLQVLKAEGASLSGSIPSEIGNWTNLEKLILVGESQKFEGSLPSTLSMLLKLDTLRIENYMAVTGTLPSELASLEALTDLRLRLTSLLGSLPTEYGQMSKLAIIDLSFNDITGTVPSEFANLTNLKNLFLHHSDLTGSVPAGICKLSFVNFWADCKDASVLDCKCCTQCQWNP